MIKSAIIMNKSKIYIYLAWFQSLIALIGSLFYSEVALLRPCILCWYQRILMYPLVWIIAVCILKKDKNAGFIVLPLSLGGAAIALYHYLLQRGIIPDTLAPCAEGISCTDRLVEYFGFITIPFLSMVGFLVISVCMFLYHRSVKADRQNS